MLYMWFNCPKTFCSDVRFDINRTILGRDPSHAATDYVLFLHTSYELNLCAYIFRIISGRLALTLPSSLWNKDVNIQRRHFSQINGGDVPYVQLEVQGPSGQGSLFSLFREKPPEKKLLLLADFLKNWAPFIKKINFANFYRPKSQKVRKCS